MNRLRVLIVDDEAPARERLLTLLGDIAGEMPTRVVGAVGDGLAALACLADAPADVALVDIRMPRMGGIELAGHLRRMAGAPRVIFTTAFEHHAVQAFELNALDYLLKPIRAERLLTALRKARAPAAAESGVAVENLQSLGDESRRYFSCLERGRLSLIPVDEVLFLRADAKYVIARTRERDYLLDESLQKLEDEFPGVFVRLHRGVLVARAALAGFARRTDGEGEHWVARVRGVDDELPVSRRQWPLLKDLVR